MKTALLGFASLALVLSVPSIASAATVKYTVKLDSTQVVPPTDSTATGTAVLDFDDATSELSGQVNLTLNDGTKVQSQYIHVGKCGASGPSKANLTEPGLNGVIVIDPPKKLDTSLVEALGKGELYINIRTEKYPGGELRGQILPEGGSLTCPQSGNAATGDGGATATPTPNMGPDGGSATGEEKSGGCNAGSGSTGSGAALAFAALGLVGLVTRRRR